MNKTFKRIIAVVLATLIVFAMTMSIGYAYTEDVVEVEKLAEEIIPATSEVAVQPTFSSDITFTSEYIEKEGIMPYGLYSPSCANDNNESALIVWLHGYGERCISKKSFMDTPYFQRKLNNWETEGFNAYIICPQLTGKYGYEHWSTKRCENDLRNLLADFISNHNIDESKIYVMGYSTGGQGAVYHSIKMNDVFAKAVVMSGFASNNLNYSEITIPMLGFEGEVAEGEYSSSVYFMEKCIKPVIGEENYFVLDGVGHGTPYRVMKTDADANNRIDVFEWLFEE